MGRELLKRSTAGWMPSWCKKLAADILLSGLGQGLNDKTANRFIVFNRFITSGNPH
jgi:hypothetical protein